MGPAVYWYPRLAEGDLRHHAANANSEYHGGRSHPKKTTSWVALPSTVERKKYRRRVMKSHPSRGS